MKRIAAAVLFALCTQAAAAPLPQGATARKSVEQPKAAERFSVRPRDPTRIMSLSICTDELLLDLVQTNRIASLTFMSREPASLREWPQAASVPTNHGTAEEVLRTRPDLVVADSFLPQSLRTLVAKSGARLVLIPPAQNFPQIRAVTRAMAGAVGDPARGERLIAAMDEQLATVAARRPATAVRAMEWGSGGYVPGPGGLFDAMLTAAGGVNVERGATGYYDVEALLAANPRVLVYGDTYRNMPSLRADQDFHLALRKQFVRISYPSLYGCGIPQSAEAALKMQQGLIAAVKQP